tara:strand:+ start:98 stop:280 length:183 start_codon:yes stop_codon:yes gene_type:complete
MSNARRFSLGDLVSIFDQKTAVIVDIHENEFGIFYNVMLDDKLLLMSEQELEPGEINDCR